MVEAGLWLLALAVDLNELHLNLRLGRHEEELVWDLSLRDTLAEDAAEAIYTLVPDLEPLLLTEHVIVQIEMALFFGDEAHLMPVNMLWIEVSDAIFVFYFSTLLQRVNLPVHILKVDRDHLTQNCVIRLTTTVQIIVAVEEEASTVAARLQDTVSALARSKDVHLAVWRIIADDLITAAPVAHFAAKYKEHFSFVADIVETVAANETSLLILIIDL